MEEKVARVVWKVAKFSNKIAVGNTGRLQFSLCFASS